MRGSSLAWPASLERLRPFIVTYCSARTVDDMSDDVRAVIVAGGFRHPHLNLALFALDADGKLLRSYDPFVRPPYFHFDPELQGRDFRRQLDDMLDGLNLPAHAAASPAKLTLPDAAGNDPLAGVRVYLTFGTNKLNHYRTPTVEAVAFTAAMRALLRYPDAPRSIAAAELRPLLSQLYPPAIMDGHGGCRRIDADLTLAPAGSENGQRQAILKGTVSIELDNPNRTRYDGPLALVLRYGGDDPAPRSLRGTGSWTVPKHNPQGQVVESIRMIAAFESRPD